MGAAIAQARLQPEDCFGLTRAADHPRHRGQRGRELERAHRGRAAVRRAPTSRAPSPRRRRTPTLRRPVPPRAPRLGGRRRVERAVALRRPAHAGPAPAPAELVAGAPHRPPRGRRHRTARLLRRAGHAHAHRRPRRPLTRELPQELHAPEAPVRGRHAAGARPDRADPRAGLPRPPRVRARAARAGAPTSATSCSARLDHRTGEREPIVVDDHPRPSFAEEVFDLFNPLDPISRPAADLQPQRAAEPRPVLRRAALTDRHDHAAARREAEGGAHGHELHLAARPQRDAVRAATLPAVHGPQHARLRGG